MKTLLSLMLTLVASTASADELPGIKTADEHPASGYDRDEWDDGGWADLDADCQNGRHEILIAQAVRGSLKLSPNGCKVVDGVWIDPYTGNTLRAYTAEQVDKNVEIDHLVPLREAHDSGAWAWPVERKRTYYQDLTIGALYAVHGRDNSSKGHKEALTPERL